MAKGWWVHQFAACLKGDSCLARSGVGFWQAFSTYKIISLFFLETKFNYCALSISIHVYCIYQFIHTIILWRGFNYSVFITFFIFRCGVSVHSCDMWVLGFKLRSSGLEARTLPHWASLLAHGVCCENRGCGGVSSNQPQAQLTGRAGNVLL